MGIDHEHESRASSPSNEVYRTCRAALLLGMAEGIEERLAER